MGKEGSRFDPGLRYECKGTAMKESGELVVESLADKHDTSQEGGEISTAQLVKCYILVLHALEPRNKLGSRRRCAYATPQTNPDMTAYNYRAFVEYARIMSIERVAMNNEGRVEKGMDRNATIVVPLRSREKLVGEGELVRKASVILIFAKAWSGCATLKWRSQKEHAMYKYYLDVDGNVWPGRFRWLLSSLVLICSSTMAVDVSPPSPPMNILKYTVRLT
ncbi:hypothetical protein ARMGADRAFT_1067771 [Armillaria gallica]|uniref:Uncharacterized protein n=1 Tax=Armillaria gallica TaxID=47427 RepID=A0A2H3CK77_ARMGA|nr:hypothetical protein ARMGADRAFT_1067771 [Armillaria gallica]